MSSLVRRSAFLTGLALAGALACGSAFAAPQGPSGPTTVTLVGSHGTYDLPTDTAPTLGAFAQDKGLRLGSYRTADNKPAKPSLTVSPETHITLYEVVSSNKNRRLPLRHPVTTVATDQLFAGETKQVAKGKDGVALFTTVTTSLYGLPASASTTTSLTVLKAPQAEIIWKGTKPKRVEVPTDEGTTTSATPSKATPSSPAKQAPKQVLPMSKTKAVTVSASTYSTLQPELALLARKQVGKSYVWGATGPEAFDCSGLIYYIYTQVGVKIPRYTAAQFGAASTPITFDELQQGDILWNEGHIGVYIGKGLTVHAANRHSGVKISPLSYWKSGYQAGRLLEPSA